MNVQTVETNVGEFANQLDSFGQTSADKLGAIGQSAAFGRIAGDAETAGLVLALGEMQQVVVGLGLAALEAALLAFTVGLFGSFAIKGF